MAKTWNDFLPDVLPSCKGIPISQARTEIRKAAIDFCGETLCWKEDLDELTTTSGVTEYLLDPPDSESAIVALVSVRRDSTSGHLLQPGSRYTFDAVSARFVLLDTPGSAFVLYINAAVKPSRTSSGLPDGLFEEYADGIAARAKARILGMPGHAWSDPQMSMYYNETYLNEAAKAKRRSSKQYSVGNSHVQWRSFGF